MNDLDCMPVKDANGNYHCSECGWSPPDGIRTPFRRNCPHAESPERRARLLAAARERLRFSIKGRRYVRSLLSWARKGFPTRPRRLVERIVRVCESCPNGHYENGRCMYCGCRVRVRGFPVFNKAAMATAFCELGHWKEILGPER